MISYFQRKRWRIELNDCISSINQNCLGTFKEHLPHLKGKHSLTENDLRKIAFDSKMMDKISKNTSLRREIDSFVKLDCKVHHIRYIFKRIVGKYPV